MARKIQLVSELAGQTARSVTQDAGSWKQYLDTASRLYKYSFDDQLLIHAQRPNAIACAAMEIWNDRMRRWVKPGSKGIALIRENEGGRPHLEYVFDIADTRPVRGARALYLWEMRKEHYEAVTAALDRMYGKGNAKDLGKRLMEAAESAVDGIFGEYFNELGYDADSIFWSGRGRAEEFFRSTLTASIQYTVLIRCGVDASQYISDGEFGGITEFSNPAMLHHLGDAVSTLSMGILQEIGRTVREYDMELLKSGRKINEKTVENPKNIGYTDSDRQFNTLKRENDKNKENKGRSKDYGRTDIHEKRGLPDTGPDDGRGGRSGGDDIGQVRDAAPEFPQGTPQHDVQVHDADRQAHAAPLPDRRAGAGNGGQHGGADDEEKRRGRESEGTRPDGMAAGSEQLHGAGRGTGTPGDRLPLGNGDTEKKNKKEQETAGGKPAVSASGTENVENPAFFQLSLFPTVEEQAERIAQAQEDERRGRTAAPVPASVPKVPEGVIGRALTSGGNGKNSIPRIVAFFQKTPSTEEAAVFLQKEYGTGGKGITVAGKEYALWFDEAGFRIAPGQTTDIPGCTAVSWKRAASLISGLLRDGIYAAQEKIDAARENEYAELAEKLAYLWQDLSDEAKEAFLNISELREGFVGKGEKIKQLLQDGNGRHAAIRELDRFNRAYAEDRELMRFHYHSPKELLERLKRMDIPPQRFMAADGFEPAKGSFITDDEIDSLLRRGGSISEGKMRICSYFMQGHNAKECEKFLRDEYGEGGFGHTGYSESHGAKGIKYTRSDDYSGYAGYDTVHLNWNKVQKRIGELVRAGKYLTPQEEAYKTDYELLQIARGIYAFFYYDPNSKKPNDRDEWDAESPLRDFVPMLKDRELSQYIYEDMAESFAVLPPDDRHYNTMKKAVEDMASFMRGEYSLFTPLPEETLQAERNKKRLEKEAAKQETLQKKPAVEKEPAGELEKAARALARKQKKIKERPDGQLSFDFAAVNAVETAPEQKAGTEKPEQSVKPQETETGKTEKPQQAVKAHEPETGKTEKQQNEQNKQPEIPAPEKAPAELYSEALALVSGAVKNSGFDEYLRGLGEDLSNAAAELDGELDYFIDELADSRQDLYSAFQQPSFREKIVGDITEDIQKAPAEHHADKEEKPDAPRHAEKKENPAQTVDTAPEKSEAETTAEPNLTPNVDEYLNLKVKHPDKLIGIQSGEYILFYGKDAEAAADALGTNIITREVKGLGEVYVTGSTETWQAVQEKLLEHGHSTLIAAPAGEHEENIPYYIIKNSDVSDYIPIGMQLEIDGRRMKIDSVDYVHGEASLLDMDMQGWFPVFRKEPVSFVRGYVEEAIAAGELTESGTAPAEEKQPEKTEADVPELPQEAAEMAELGMPQEAAETAVHQEAAKTAETEPQEAAETDAAGEKQAAPETEPVQELIEIGGGQLTADTMKIYNSPDLPYEIGIQVLKTTPEKHNYHITDDALGTGGQKTKYQNNISAIRTLKQIEAQGRMAAPEEQEILSKYVGWGGLAQAFDPDNEKWAKEYAELKEMMTPEEYESARSTVLNAHYTSPIVIKAMYEAVGNMDFTPGNVLEPSCGTGNFFGLVPEKMGKADLYGVEIDPLTGRIAKQLYQKADITVGGFETTQHPDDFFDLAVGNVPFGEYKVHDRRYDRQNLLIHDYFLIKTLDKIRPGGIMAFITTKGTMDKADSRVRESLAQKADLLGAVRLPNNAFKANAGTEVTADILFFQKRGSAPKMLPEWVNTGRTEDGVPLNNYFIQHPEMVLGKMSFWENMYGNKTETACLPIEGADLQAQLSEAVRNIALPDRELLHMDAPEQEKDKKTGTIAADPNVRNFSFTEKTGKIYFRENSRMKPMELGKTPTARVKGMIAVRDCARRLIDLQLGGAGDDEIKAAQTELNKLYDSFQKKYGLLNSTGNRLAFHQDSSYPLLCSLEVLDGEGNLKRKADMFTKRTIQHRQPVTSVDTAVEALGVSIGERACVDLGYMASLMGGSDKIPQIISDLKGIIFKEPTTGPSDLSPSNADWNRGWQTSDEYLSGDVRKKLEQARAAAEKYPEFAVNVEALEKVQPKDLAAPEIRVRIGAPWVDTKYYKQFMFELMQTPYRLQGGKMDVLYSDSTGEWRVKGKGEDSPTNSRVWRTYGTKRINAYEIFEACLNQRSVQIFDTRTDAEGRERRVLNEKETAIAQQKQDALKEAFADWIFKDPDRRTDLCTAYNRLFNSIRPREYDGQHISFIGMNPEIKLEKHQKNAVARILYGKNTLLAHVVGAGKTFEMAAAAMESKRLGLCRKSMIVVPNHLTEQWGSDFLTLYPGANVLVATKKDFEPKNRKKFCARIATGDFDAVIIGHSQFEKIPISPERQEAVIQGQIDEIMEAIEDAKASREEKFTIKQMEKTKKSLEAKLAKLYDKKKDDTVTFEELGIDRLFVDEAHAFKNLYMHTKMRNVAGISQTDAQKSSDMFAKCRYMDEITGGRGITFATGTPVSNSMVELYTMMRYLQYDMLEQGFKDSTGKTRSLKHFDNWAATFGEQVSAVELKPEGTGFRLKTRFARFYNIPELMSRWKEAADIQTADMLKLPVPEAKYVTVQTEPSEAQKMMVEKLGERAEKIRTGRIDPRLDNMLKVTSDGRKLALDQRIMNPLLPDDPGSKVNACVDNVFKIWEESTPTKGAQLIFSDLSTPKGKAGSEKETKKEAGDGEITDTAKAGTELSVVTDTESDTEPPKNEDAMEAGVYEDIRAKLIAKGIPRQEIAFIHEAGTDAQKAELFAKVRSGQVRILLGSTQKMGAGTNVQTKLVASHDLDCPWRPADLEQRAGRIVRRGNENGHVKIFRYVTKGTFDAYTWGLIESKQKFIGQVMTSKSPARSIEDVDAAALSYAEVKMLATGDTRIKEKMDLDIQVTKLKMLKANHQAQQFEMQDKVREFYPNKIKETELYIDCLTADLPLLEANPVKEDVFTMTVMGTEYKERKEAGAAVIAACRLMDDPGKEIELGQFRGFPMKLCFDGAKFKVAMKQHMTHTAELSDDAAGNITRINNALEKIPESLERHRENLKNLHKELESAKEEAERPFAQEEELLEKSARLAQLNTELDNAERPAVPSEDTEEKQEEEQAQTPAGDAGTLPARDKIESAKDAGGKASILKTIREYGRPAAVHQNTGRSVEREVL